MMRTIEENNAMILKYISGIPETYVMRFGYDDSVLPDEEDLDIQFGSFHLEKKYEVPHMLQLKLLDESIVDFTLSKLKDNNYPFIFRKKEYHVTISYNKSPKNRMDKEMEIFTPFIQKEIILKAQKLVYDSKGVAISVELPQELKSLKEYPHITISNSPGIQPVYSNELLKKSKEDDNIRVVDISNIAPIIPVIGLVIPFRKK